MGKKWVRNVSLVLALLMSMAFAEGALPELFTGKAEEAGVAIDAVNFPDVNFRAYVSEKCDTDKDGTLSKKEISAAYLMHIYERNIASLKGIEFFTDLLVLYCYGNALTTLDVSRNTKLTSLSCGYNQLSALDLTHNNKLSDLSCARNQLTTLDLSGNTALAYLNCEDNALRSLNVRGCNALRELDCSGNQLVELDLSGKLVLEVVDCIGNQLVQLNVDGCPDLRDLRCERNSLAALNISDCPMLVFISSPEYGNEVELYDQDVFIGYAMHYMDTSIDKTDPRDRIFLFVDSDVQLIKDAPTPTAETHFALPQGLEKIESMAFYNCFSDAVISEITVPASCRSIGNKAFANCFGLRTIVFEDGNLEVAEDFVSGCSKNLKIVAPEGSTVAKNESLYRKYLR